MPNLCAYCSKEFEKKTHNQKYCDSECCRKATNERIMKRYYERRDNRLGVNKRVCKNPDCNIPLSRYNEESYCSRHATYRGGEKQKLMEILKKK